MEALQHLEIWKCVLKQQVLTLIIKPAKRIGKRKRLIGGNNIPSNHTRRLILTINSSTLIAPVTMRSSTILDRHSTKSKNLSRRTTSRRNPLPPCHGTLCVPPQAPCGTDSAGSSHHAIPIGAYVGRSEPSQDHSIPRE